MGEWMSGRMIPAGWPDAIWGVDVQPVQPDANACILIYVFCRYGFLTRSTLMLKFDTQEILPL
jgi:hypothetical protein